MPDAKHLLWDAFTAAHRIREAGIPLFASTPEGRAHASPFGTDKRLILQRSLEMDALLIAQADLVLRDPATGGEGLDGILYMMHWRDGDRVLPLYIGRAGKHGRRTNLSANLLNLATDKSKFARWGSNYAYHIGDLSAASCPGHDAKKLTPKYARWAARLFADCPSASPLLHQPVYFWATAWGPSSPSIWREYGASSLSFQEYLLIGVASDLFPGVLLNDEGVNRAGPVSEPVRAGG